MDMLQPNTEQVQLIWSNDGATLTVTPDNEDRFAIRKQKLIEFLKLAAKSEQFDQQLDFLIKQLATWLSGREDVQAAYLTVIEGTLSFAVLQKHVKFSDTFDDELSQLDHDLANDSDLDLIKMNTLSLPPISNTALNQFLDPRFVVRFEHGN